MTEKEERLDEELAKTAEETAETTESSNESTETEAQTPQPEEEAVEKSELELLQEKNNELEDQFLRARAEIANITSRNRNERELLQKYRSQDLGKKLLPAIDNLERAMAADVDQDQAANLKKGVEMVLESLRQALKEEGIEEIPAEGAMLIQTCIKRCRLYLPLMKHRQTQSLLSCKKGINCMIVSCVQAWSSLHNSSFYL